MFTLKNAADYFRTRKAPSFLLSILLRARAIFDFDQERANRLRRFVKIARAYRDGEAVADIADEYGCSRNTVKRYARLAGLPIRPRGFPKDVRSSVIEDYKNKNQMPVKEIATLNGVSVAYVSKVATEAGISRYKARGDGGSRMALWRKRRREKDGGR